jgi:hypothetical protein
MLTKQEREATIERIKSYGDSDLPFYKLLFGSRAPYAMQYTEYLKALKDRVIDLCDTSNMLELPVDKDGEAICPGDTVYVDDDVKYEVVGYMMRGNSTEIILAAGAEPVYTKEPANKLTHKKPVTIASLVKELTDIVAADYGTPMVVKRKLSDIADQLEKLGGSDD